MSLLWSEYEVAFQELVDAAFQYERSTAPEYYNSLTPRVEHIIYRDTRYNLDFLPAVEPRFAPSRYEEQITRYMDSLLHKNTRQALFQVQQFLADGIALPDVYMEILGESMRQVGELWHTARITVDAEHNCTSVTMPQPILRLAPLGTAVQLSPLPVQKLCFEQNSGTIKPDHSARKAGAGMAHILILGGGAAGLAAALAAAQTNPSARVTVLERSPRAGKKLLATGNGRCNLDNEGITAEGYSSASPAALDTLLASVHTADPLGWFRTLGLYTRTDETGRVYPYSNQAADVLALLEHHLARHGVEMRTGCTVQTLSQSRGGYVVLFTNADGADESLRADAVICALGGSAGPQFGTDGFGPRFAAQCGGKLAPLYPCLTALQCAKPDKSLAGIRAKARSSLWSGRTLLAEDRGEVQFTDYGLSGICIMDLTRHLTPAVKAPAVELDLFPDMAEDTLAGLFTARLPLLAGDTAADFWLGLLNAKLGRALWRAAGLPDADVHRLSAAQWQKLARTAKHWRFEGLTPCGWKQAQVTGGGLALTELEPEFQFKGCPGLYFVGETLDCTGRCGGYNLHWAFGSGLAAGRSAAKQRHAAPPQKSPRKKKH